jgi:hypothetical protein
MFREFMLENEGFMPSAGDYALGHQKLRKLANLTSNI